MMNSQKQSVITNLVYTATLALLIFAPLAFGAMHVWAYTVIEIGVFFLLALYLLDQMLRKGGRVEWVKTPVNWVLVAFLAVIGLQMVPMPPAVVKFLSPLTYADKRQMLDVLAAAGDTSAAGNQWMPLAYYLHATWREFLKAVAYIGMFFLVLNTATSQKRLNILVLVLISVGLFEALYAVCQNFSDAPRVWWWKSRVGRAHYASGTYIVSNHFAGYMEMVLPMALGWMMALKKRSHRAASKHRGSRRPVRRLVEWFAPESAGPGVLVFGFASVIMGVALLMSASRGGILSFGVAMTVTAVLFFKRRRYRKYGAAMLVLCLVMVGYALTIGIDPALKKFESSEAGLSKRLTTSRSMIPMAGDYPVAGTGWGTFRYLYPRYVPEDYDGVYTSGFSHDDWLEAVTDLGLPGGLLLVAAFWIYWVKMLRLWFNRHDARALGIGAGVLTGLTSMGIHSFFDFNMHVPANPLTLAAMLGLGYAALHRQGRGYSESFFYSRRTVFVKRFWKIPGIAAVLLLLAVGAVTAGRHLAAEASCATEWNSTMNLKWNPLPGDIEQAVSANPFNAEHYFKQAQWFETRKASDDGERITFNDQAVSALQQAVRLNPARGLFWYHLGKRYTLKSYDPYGYLNQWLPLGEKCFDIALKCSPMDAVMQFDVAWYWVWRSSILPENADVPVDSTDAVTSGEEGVRKFQHHFRRALRLKPHLWKRAVERVWEYYPTDRIVLKCMPETDKKLQSRVLQWVARSYSPEKNL